jgi:putative ABC transport system permease protein
MTRARTWEPEALRLFRGLLFLYPAEFRAEYGRELCLVFADRCREERSLAGLFAIGLEAILGILTEAPREHCHMIVQDFRHALRVLRKDAPVTAAAIAILALGIGSATLVFSLVNGLLLRPLPYPGQERIVAVNEYSPNERQAENGSLAFPNYADLRARTHLLRDLGVYTSDQFTLRGEGAAERVPGAGVSDGVFRVLGVAPLLGRVFTRADVLPHGPQVILLGEELWDRRYGRDPHILGRRLDVAGVRATVVGVMPASFHFPDRAEIWSPLQLDPTAVRRTDHYLHGVARLRPGVSVAQANAEIAALFQQIQRENPAANNGWRTRVVPYRDFLASSYRLTVLTLLAAVGLLLAIACANVSNLLLVKASARAGEMAVRTALGATRRRLARQLVSEGVVLGLAGGALGVLLAGLGVPALLALVPIDLPRWMVFSLDHRVLGFALAVSLLTSIGFGLAPAIGSFGELSGALKGSGRGGTTGLRQKLLRQGLVVGEVALSVTLLTGAGLLVKSFMALKGQSLGYRTESVLAVRFAYPENRYAEGAPATRALMSRIAEQASSLPGVTAAAVSSGVPLDDGWGRIFTIEGRPRPLKDMSYVNHVVTTPGYFRTLGIPLLRGRDFTAADYDAPRIVVVSRSFAERYWPHESAIGKRIQFGPPDRNEPWHTVVGVAADSRHGHLKGEDRPNVYLPYSRDFSMDALLVRSSADPQRLVSALRSRIVGIDRDIAVSPAATLAQIVDRVSWRDRFTTVLFGAFAALALVLAAVGLYATLSYTVSLQTHEIGIRMALGATAARVRGGVLRQGLTLAGVGLAVGIAAALGLTRLLSAQLYAVSPLDPTAYASALLVLLAVALLAAFVPTRRAIRVDPVIALRQE